MKKRLIALALLSAASGSSIAASANYNATVNAISDANIENTTPLHFGAMQPQVGAACVMATGGAVTGDCDATDANISIGLVTVSSLSANTPMNITVTGTDGTNVGFDADYNINNAQGTHTGIADGTQTAIITNGTADDITIDVFGTMTVLQALTPGSTYVAEYTVDVSFQ
ncbi:hypothetical protein MTsDn1_16500 [Alteromonas sp. MTD1]|uniref:hypothetical protein n=1 Tax=Alteromonas sp. MTD1 TaxID=3057962 RepID=UPI0036F31809